MDSTARDSGPGPDRPDGRRRPQSRRHRPRTKPTSSSCRGRPAEGIAKGDGSTFTPDLFTGDILRRRARGTAKLFIDAPVGRFAAGMAFDRRHICSSWPVGRPGRRTCTTRVPALPSGRTSSVHRVGIHQRRRSDPPRGLVHRFVEAMLYFVPLTRGTPARSRPSRSPAPPRSRGFNLNESERLGGQTLIVPQRQRDSLHRQPHTGASAAIAGISVPNVDGIVLSGHRVWAGRTSATRSPASA